MSFFRGFAKTTFKDFERITKKVVVKDIPRALVGIEDLAVQAISGGINELKTVVPKQPTPALVANKLRGLARKGLDKVEQSPAIDTARNVIKLEGVSANSLFNPNGEVVQGLVAPVIAIEASIQKRAVPRIKRAVKKVVAGEKKLLKKALKAEQKVVKKVAPLTKKVAKRVVRRARKTRVPKSAMSQLEKLKSGIMKSKDVRKFIVKNRAVINKMKKAEKIAFLGIARGLL